MTRTAHGQLALIARLDPNHYVFRAILHIIQAVNPDAQLKIIMQVPDELDPTLMKAKEKVLELTQSLTNVVVDFVQLEPPSASQTL